MKITYRIFKNFLSRMKFGRHNKIQSFRVLSLKANINGTYLGKGAMVAAHASIINCKIGDFSSIGRYSKISYSEIGKYCAISWDCTINATRHPTNHLTISAFPYVPEVGNFVKIRRKLHEKVTIGNDVWIGANSVVMPGINVGHGSIIGAGSVVTKDIPPYAIVGGVPARIIKYRFDKEVVKRLLDLQWWNWPDKKVKEMIECFSKPVNMKLIDELIISN